MKLEINERFAPTDRPFAVAGCEVMVTPPLDEDYWLARVDLGGNAIVCFPKFGTIGIGFQKETNWNTNLPYSSEPERIWGHIEHNRADESITPERGIEAIKAVQEYARALKS
jgi:hypothetical protein